MTSSSRSAGYARSGRQVGGVTVQTAAAVSTVQPTWVSRRSTSGAAIGSPAVRPGRAGSSSMCRTARGWSTSVEPTCAAPPSSPSSWTARVEATGGSSGSTPRSNRFAASLDTLCRRAIRATATGAKCAASITSSVDAASISVVSPPMVPARPTAPESSAMTTSPGSRVRVTWSSVSSTSPGSARRTVTAP